MNTKSWWKRYLGVALLMLLASVVLHVFLTIEVYFIAMVLMLIGVLLIIES